MKYVEVKWYDPEQTPPPERETVIGYTENGEFRDITLRNGKFDTYLKIVRWCYAPKPPIVDGVQAPKKSRKKKSA